MTCQHLDGVSKFRFLLIVIVFFIASFCGWLVVYKTGINSLAIQSEDTLPAMFLPITILKEGTFYVDSYYDMLVKRYPHPDDKSYTKGLTPFYLRKIVKEDPTKSCIGEGCALEKHYISAFPVVAGLLSLPVYAVPVLAGLPITWDNLILLSHLSASLILALSGGFFYLLVKMLLGKNAILGDNLSQDGVGTTWSDEKSAIMLTGIYLFGTVNFAMISQALWQHGAVQLFTILALLFLVKTLPDKFVSSGGVINRSGNYLNLVISGLFLGLAVLARPTAGILLPYFVILAIFFVNSELMSDSISINNIFSITKTKLGLLAGLVPALAFFIWYTAVYFGSIANQGYSDQLSVNWLTPFPWGFLGLWLSPSKGLLVYSPVFIFSIIGAVLALRKHSWKVNFMYLVFLCIVLTHNLILGAWKHWYGGYSFGYRMASDVIPFLVLPLIPYLKSAIFTKTKKLFYGAIILAVLLELMGLAFFDGIWHGTYDKGFWHQSWLWSIKDSEAVFNIRRLLVKLGL